jgi:hypothetical protein
MTTDEMLAKLRSTPALQEVLEERVRQEAKWGQQNHDPFLYLTILGEEYGETCKAALEDMLLCHLREEAVQTAAVALAIVECLDREIWRWSTTRPRQEDGETLDIACKDYDLLHRKHKQEPIQHEQQDHYEAGWEAAVQFYFG